MYEKYCYMQLYLRSKWKLFGFESEECAIEIINSFQILNLSTTLHKGKSL